jgi:hypothetical protein
MNCPHCQKEISPADIAKHMRSFKSEARSEASRLNGAKSKGRPKKLNAKRREGKKIPKSFYEGLADAKAGRVVDMETALTAKRLKGR